MLAPWVIEEMKRVDLGDARLNARLFKLLDEFGSRPTASIPAACGGYAEMAAAYRFCDNEKVTFSKVLQPHIEATRVRVAANPVVLMVQDTTEIDVTRPMQQVKGAGPLDGDSRRGALLHVLHAFTPDATPLGTVGAEVLIRDDDKPLNRTKSRGERQKIPIEEKESHRWLETLRQTHEEARRAPETDIICIADSESDIYELLAETIKAPSNAHFIVRACQDRALLLDVAENDASEASAKLLRNHLLSQSVVGAIEVAVRGREAKVGCEERGRRQSRKSRTAQVEIRAARVTLRPPYRSDRKLPPVTVNVVYAYEPHPPEGEPGLEWILLGDRPIDTLDQIYAYIQTYCVRWMIEVFFRTLKSGCRAEKRRFEQMDRLLPCLAIYLIVTWRTLFVCRVGRDCPDASCEMVFTPSEWKAVYAVVVGQPLPAQPPTLQAMLCLVAQLGGYVNRKRKDPPGPQTVWLGLQRLHDIVWCWNTFGPGANESG
jgi:Transposase DNA-binding/Transposase Tn5 dimerisation domain